MQALLVLLLTTFQIFNQPIKDQYNLKVTWEDNGNTQEARVLLVDRTNANRFWELGKVHETGGVHFAVDRADQDSIVMNARNDYGILSSSYKLFFNTSSKQVTKQVAFSPPEAMAAVNDQEAVRAGVPPEIFRQVKNIQQPTLPQTLKDHPLPQPTFAQFAKIKPKEAAFGKPDDPEFLSEHTVIGFHAVGNRIWVGKDFYASEGRHGIGGVGYFDLTSSTYTFLDVPEVIDWSVASLLVEDGNTLWAGLLHHPEGEDQSGGLLRYDLKTGRAKIFPVNDVVRKIVRSGNTLFLGTAYGIYSLTNDKFTRYRAEPNRTGGFILVTDNP